MLAKGNLNFTRYYKVLLSSLKSLDLLDVAGLPTLVERCFGRAVEPEYGKIPLARHGREPVASLAIGCFGAEVKVIEFLLPVSSPLRRYLVFGQFTWARDFNAYFPRFCLFSSCKSSEAFIGFYEICP
jgi:hypothetical protein